MFLSHIDDSLSLSLTPPRLPSRSNEKIMSLGEDKKNSVFITYTTGMAILRKVESFNKLDYYPLNLPVMS